MKKLTSLALAAGLAGCCPDNDTADSLFDSQDSHIEDTDTGQTHTGETGHTGDTGDSGEPLPDPKECEIKLYDTESGEPISFELTHAEGTSDPQLIRSMTSLYGDFVLLTADIAGHNKEGKLPFVPLRMADHDIQTAWEEAGNELTASMTIEASWPNGTTCTDTIDAPFREWEQPVRNNFATGKYADQEKLAEVNTEPFDNKFGLLDFCHEDYTQDDYAHDTFLTIPVTGDLLVQYTMSKDDMEELGRSVGNAQYSGPLAASTIQNGNIIMMSEAWASLQQAQLFEFSLTGEVLNSYDTTPYADSLEEDLQAHNGIINNPSEERAVDTILWQRREAGDTEGSDFKSTIATLHLADDLSIESYDVWFNPGTASTLDLTYGNALSVSSKGVDGSVFKTATYPALWGHNQEVDYLEKPFIVAGSIDSESPEYIFVRQGYSHVALRKDLTSNYPDMRVVEIPDVEGVPAMDFPHDANLTRLDSDMLKLWILSLGEGDENHARVNSFYINTDENTVAPGCTFVPEQDPRSHSNIFVLPGDSLVGMHSARYGNMEWFDAETCEPVMQHLVEGQKPRGLEIANPRWNHQIKAGNLVDGDYLSSVTLEHDFEQGADLFGEIEQE